MFVTAPASVRRTSLPVVRTVKASRHTTGTPAMYALKPVTTDVPPCPALRTSLTETSPTPITAFGGTSLPAG